MAKRAIFQYPKPMPTLVNILSFIPVVLVILNLFLMIGGFTQTVSFPMEMAVLYTAMLYTLGIRTGRLWVVNVYTIACAINCAASLVAHEYVPHANVSVSSAQACLYGLSVILFLFLHTKENKKWFKACKDVRKEMGVKNIKSFYKPRIILSVVTIAVSVLSFQINSFVNGFIPKSQIYAELQSKEFNSILCKKIEAKPELLAILKRDHMNFHSCTKIMQKNAKQCIARLDHRIPAKVKAVNKQKYVKLISSCTARKTFL